MTSATLTRADQLTVTEYTKFSEEQKVRLLACSPTERAALIGEPTDADLEPIIAYVRISDDREGRQAGIGRLLLVLGPVASLGLSDPGRDIGGPDSVFDGGCSPGWR